MLEGRTMLNFITGRTYKPPTVETVVDYSGDEMPTATRRRRSKEREQAHRERRKAEKDAEIRSAVSTRSSKSSHSSREDDAMREERRRERKERKNRDRDCASSVSTSSASKVSRRTGSMVVKLSDVESMKTLPQPAAAAISTAQAGAGRKRSPTMPTTLPTMRSLESEERDRSQTPKPVREQRSDPTLKVSTQPVTVTAAPHLPSPKPAHVAAPAPEVPVARARTASPGFGRQFPPPTHGIATPPHTPDSKTPMPVPEAVPTQQLSPTPVAEGELAKHSEAPTGALVRRPHRPHVRTGSEVRFASPATDGARTPRSWKPQQHRHHSEGYEQGYFPPQPYYRQDSNGRHKGELPPPPDYLYRQQRPQSAAGYYHQQEYYPKTYPLPAASHDQASSPQSPPESAKSQPLPEREREVPTRSYSAKPIRHSLQPPPPLQQDYYAYYPYHVYTPPSQTPPLAHHVPRYPPPPPTAADIEFSEPGAKRERKRRHSMHYSLSSPYDPHHAQYQHHSRVMTPVEGISPTSRPFHDFPPPGSSLKRLIPSRLALSSSSSGDSSSHRLPPPPEFTPNGSRNGFRYMDEAQEERKARSLEFDNETTLTSMVAVSTEYPTRERRAAMPRYVRRRALEEMENMAVVGSMRAEAGEKMEREESVASGGSVASGVPLPPLARAGVEVESEKFEVERPKLLPPAEFCEEVSVFEEDDEVGQVVEGGEEGTEKDMPIVEEVEVAVEAPIPDTLEAVTEEELEQEEESEQSEEDEEEEDQAEEDEEENLQEEEEEEEEEDCDTVVGLDSGHEEIIGMEMVMDGILESVEECNDEEEEEEEEEGSDLEEEEEEYEEAEHGEDEDDRHEPHMEEHQQAIGSTYSDSDLGVSIDHDDEEHDQTAEGFLANLDNSSAPASSIFSTQSSATTVITLDSMFPSTTQSSASSAPTTISTLTSTDYSSGSSSASYTPQYMPAAFAYAPSPPPSTATSSTEYSCSTANSSATTQYPTRNPHMMGMGMGMGIPHTPPRTQPGTRTTSPQVYKRTPLFPQQTGMLPMTLTEPQAFPRFTSLNLRLLRHLESELVELERMLEEFEARMVNEGPQISPENVDYHQMNEASPHGSVRSRVNSGSSVSSSSMPGGIGGVKAKRAEIMDALAWKLGQYNQALVNYQTMMDTFGPTLDPCSPTTPLRRPASRDSGVASSRGSSGVRLSDCDITSEQPACDYGGDCFESIPGGWETQEQQHEHEVPPEVGAQTQLTGEAQEKKDPGTAAEGACIPHAQDIDIVLTGKRPTWNSTKRNEYSRSVSSTSSSSACCSSCHPSPAQSPSSHSSTSSSPERPETTLTEILAPPFLLLVVLYSLEWVSGWGKLLALVMVLGVGKAWKRGLEEGEKRSEQGRGRSGVRRERCGVGV